tara:strand:- start:146 stop:457 length:312 start_codon:yes stop_codon:yes gene_type:complete
MNIDFKCQETEHFIQNDEKNYNDNIDIDNKIIIDKKNNYLNIYFLFICCLVISNIVVSVFIFIYLQNINNEVSSIFSNSTLIEHVKKLEKIIDIICKNIIVGC